MVGIHDFAKGFAEIPDQGAADASGIHFTDLDAGFFQESAVDADLSEFIFDQYDLLACKRLGEQLLISVVFPAPRKPEMISIFVI